MERKLYPNIDFHGGSIMRALGTSTQVFPVMFAIGRMPGWIANFKEIREDSKSRICRPRQVLTGPANKSYVSKEKRPGVSREGAPSRS